MMNITIAQLRQLHKKIYSLCVCFLGNNVIIFYAVIYILKTVSVFNHVTIIFPTVFWFYYKIKSHISVYFFHIGLFSGWIGATEDQNSCVIN